MIQTIKLYYQQFKIYFFLGVLLFSVLSSVILTRNYVVNAYKAKENKELKSAIKERNEIAERLRIERAKLAEAQAKTTTEIIQLPGVAIDETVRESMDEKQKIACNKPLFELNKLRHSINESLRIQQP